MECLLSCFHMVSAALIDQAWDNPRSIKEAKMLESQHAVDEPQSTISGLDPQALIHSKTLLSA